MSRDEKILSFAEGRQVTVRYELNDMNLSFYTTFDQRRGALWCGRSAGKAASHAEDEGRHSRQAVYRTGERSEGGDERQAVVHRRHHQGDVVAAHSERFQSPLHRGPRRSQRSRRGFRTRRGRGTARRTIRRLPEPPATAAPSGKVASAGRILVGDIRDEVIRTVEEMYAHGLITSTGGNVSVRIPGKDEIWITPNSSFKGALRPDMLVRVDLEGNPIGDSPYAPSSERMLHCAVYRNNPSVGAVIHSHAPKATILGLAGLPFLPISTEAAFIGEIPRVPFIMPGTVELADAVGAAAKDAHAVIMQNHGLIVGGPNLRHASDMTLIIEQTADKLIACHMLGKTPPVLPDEIVTALRSLGEMIA